MKYPWTLDELILVLDFYVTWGVNPQSTEPQFQDLLELVYPHPESSVWWQVRDFRAIDEDRPGNKGDNAKLVWRELGSDPGRLRIEARKIRKNRMARSVQCR